MAAKCRSKIDENATHEVTLQSNAHLRIAAVIVEDCGDTIRALGAKP